MLKLQRLILRLRDNMPSKFFSISPHPLSSLRSPLQAIALLSVTLCTGVSVEHAIAQSLPGKKSAQALGSMNVEISRHPMDSELYIKRAQFWLDLMKPHLARKDLEHSILLKPTGKAYFLLGELQFDPTETGPALEDYAKAAKLAHGDYPLFMKLSGRYHELKKLDKECEMLSAACEILPDDPGATARLSQALFESGKYKESIRYASSFLSKSSAKKGSSKPGSHTLLHERKKWRTWCLQARGGSLLRIHDYKNALIDLNEAASEEYALGIGYIKPTFVTTLTLRSELFKITGKTKLAEQDLKTLERFRDTDASRFLKGDY